MHSGKQLESNSFLWLHKPISYAEKSLNSSRKTRRNETIIYETPAIHWIRVVFTVMNFNFMGANMQSVVGEKVVRMVDHSAKQKLSCIVILASGGAHMFE
jgi:acetyl-CoA carboxylase carboxyl transferase subunit beta